MGRRLLVNGHSLSLHASNAVSQNQVSGALFGEGNFLKLWHGGYRSVPRQLDREKACLGWLLDSTPVKLLWSSTLSDASCKAAAEGRMDVLAYMLDAVQDCDGLRWRPNSRQCMAAAAAGQIDMLEWLHEHADEDAWESCVCNAAIKANRMESLRWLHLARGPPCQVRLENLETAASMGRLDMLQLLLSTDRPCPWHASVCMHAAKHPECLKWLRRQDPPCPWNADAMRTAATIGDLSLMQWMRAQDPPCPMDSSVMTAAACRGDLAMMKWLHAQQPGLVDGCLDSAVRHGRLENVQWICQQFSGPPDFVALWVATTKNGNNLALIQWMLTHDGGVRFPWEPYMARYCYHLPTLQWLHGAGYALDPVCVHHAAQRGQACLLSWLLSIGLSPHEPSLKDDYPWPVQTLLLWGQHGLPLKTALHQQLQLARASFCTFRGLIRWCQKYFLEGRGLRPRQTAHKPLPFCSHTSLGQQLLVSLAKLPGDILTKIAVAADLQFDPSLAAAQQGNA